MSTNWEYELKMLEIQQRAQQRELDEWAKQVKAESQQLERDMVAAQRRLQYAQDTAGAEYLVLVALGGFCLFVWIISIIGKARSDAIQADEANKQQQINEKDRRHLM